MSRLRENGRAASEGRPALSFADLISPLSVEEFHRDHWERRHLVLRRDDPHFYDRLLTLSDLDEILAQSSLRSSDLRIVNQGKELPIGGNGAAAPTDIDTDSDAGAAGKTAGLANGLEELYQHYRRGSTISLTYLHERWPPLTRLCRDLAMEFSAGFQTNIYLTPPGGAQGLTPHHDTHDVIVAQIHGTKHWKLYPSPVRLPLRTQMYQMPEEGPGEPLHEFDLSPGDLLYLPRGYVHAATSGDSASLHLTIGVLPILWSDVLRSAVDRRVATDERFRRSLPVGFARDPELQRECQDEAELLLRALAVDAPTEDLVAEAVGRAWAGRQPVLHGHLLDLEELPSVALETVVLRRPELQWHIDGGSGDDDPVVLHFHGKVVRLPGRVAEEVRFVCDAGTFTAKDIPGGLDEEGRLVLIRGLLREGFLTIAR